MPVIPLSIKMVLQSMVQEVISSLLCFCENSQKEVEVFLLIFHSNGCLEFRVLSLVKLFSSLVALKVVLNRVHRSYIASFVQSSLFKFYDLVHLIGCLEQGAVSHPWSALHSRLLPPKIRFSSFYLYKYILKF